MTADKNAPYAEFGERLIRLRKEAGMTRQQLGVVCGVAPSTIINYERGTRIPYADTALKMAQTFELSVEELLGAENPAAEMMKAQAIDDMGRLFGQQAADSARHTWTARTRCSRAVSFPTRRSSTLFPLCERFCSTQRSAPSKNKRPPDSVPRNGKAKRMICVRPRTAF